MLTAAETRQLDRLAFAAAGSLSANAAGSRLARARGFGTEFHDFRRYEPGDDPRSIEWSVYARLGHLVVRTYRADAQLRVHLLVDSSASMAVGTPDKLACARKIAALLSYVAIRERDAIGLTMFDERLRPSIAPAAGRPQLLRLLDALSAAKPAGRSSLSRALIDYGTTAHGAGLAVILSDFFDPAGAWDGLRYLLHRGLTPALVQIVAAEELDPRVAGPLEFIDAEDPNGTPITVGADAVRTYIARMQALTAQLGEFCISRGLPWAQVSASASFSDIVDACRHGGLLGERM